MNTVTVDIRMLKKGSKWCATSRVTAPTVRGAVDLYACEDVRAALPMDPYGSPPSKEVVAKTSSDVRKRVRREILGLTYNLLREISGGSKEMFSRMQKALEACDHACNLVHRARGGEESAKYGIASIFARAKSGDREAERSARLIVESADLVDDGRASFRVSMTMPLGSDVPMTSREHLALPERTSMPVTGAEEKKPLALFYPGTTVPNTQSYDIPMEDVELMLEDPFEYVPYPVGDRNGYNIFQVLQPAIAAY